MQNCAYDLRSNVTKICQAILKPKLSYYKNVNLDENLNKEVGLNPIPSPSFPFPSLASQKVSWGLEDSGLIEVYTYEFVLILTFTKHGNALRYCR